MKTAADLNQDRATVAHAARVEAGLRQVFDAFGKRVAATVLQPVELAANALEHMRQRQERKINVRFSDRKLLGKISNQA